MTLEVRQVLTSSLSDLTCQSSLKSLSRLKLVFIGVLFYCLFSIILHKIMVVCRRYLMLTLHCFIFDSKVTCCTQLTLNVVSSISKPILSFHCKFFNYLYCQVSFSPSRLFCCLRKNLVGLWKGFFNQKSCRRKALEVILVTTVFCILFNINKINKSKSLVLCYLKPCVFGFSSFMKLVCTFVLYFFLVFTGRFHPSIHGEDFSEIKIKTFQIEAQHTVVFC